MSLILVDAGGIDLVEMILADLDAVGTTSDVSATLDPEAMASYGWTGDERCVVAGSDPDARSAAVEALRRAGAARFMSLIHPTATFGSDIELGEGAVVGPRARLTTNVRIGPHVWIGEGATLSHDGRLGSFVTVDDRSNITGNCRIGDRAWIRSRSVLIPGVSIGAGAVVEAGSVVIADVDGGETVGGVPAVSGPRSTSPEGDGR